MSDEEDLAALDSTWLEFKNSTLTKQKSQLRATVNLANKMRFQNLLIIKDCALMESYAHRVNKQNFELINIVEECLAKNLHYEKLLKENNIRFGSLKIDAGDGEKRVVKHTALIKYVDG